MKKIILLLTITLTLSLNIFAQNDIRKVDFNNFTYSPDFCGGEESKRKITVKDGEFMEVKEVDGFPDRLFFSVYGLTYGDLDGDKKDEAVILSLCNTGGTGNFTEAYVFKMENGKPVRKVLLVGGDRAHGGLREARVKDGLLIIESNDAGEMGGACCPQNIVTSTYQFTGKTLKEVGKATTRKIYPEERVKFDRGTFGKTYKISMGKDDQIKRFVVNAAKDQVLSVTKTSSLVNVDLVKGHDSATVLESDKRLVANLNANRDYVFEITNFTQKPVNFDMTVTIVPKGEVPTEMATAKIESIYTELDAEKCKTIELEEDGAGFYRGECKGVGNYKLEVIEGDIRQTINVIHKQSGDKWELEFWSKVSFGFSSVGSLAEWRIKKVGDKVQPVALIVRYNVTVPKEDGTNGNMSYLVVTKFDGEFVCITDVVEPMRKQNEKARELADIAPTKPCYKR